jgi:hypothetical protein
MYQLVRMVVEAETSDEAIENAEQALDELVESDGTHVDWYQRVEETDRYPDYTKTTAIRLDTKEAAEECMRAFNHARKAVLRDIKRVREVMEGMTDSEILDDGQVRYGASRLDDTIEGRELICVYGTEKVYVSRRDQYNKMLDERDSRWVVNFDVHY